MLETSKIVPRIVSKISKSEPSDETFITLSSNETRQTKSEEFVGNDQVDPRVIDEINGGRLST